MGIHTKLADDIDEVDIIIAGGKFLLISSITTKPYTDYLYQVAQQDASSPVASLSTPLTSASS
jgi:hypothetical protein